MKNFPKDMYYNLYKGQLKSFYYHDHNEKIIPCVKIILYIKYKSIKNSNMVYQNLKLFSVQNRKLSRLRF